MTTPAVVRVTVPSGPAVVRVAVPGSNLQVTGPALAGRESGTGSLVAIPIGPGLGIVDGALVLTGGEAGTGTVTGVALELPGIFSVTGSPVTSAGTLTAALATQPAGRVFAGPSSGADAAPTFRQLGYGELSGIPTLGTAAATDATAYATAAQGELADSAVQPDDLASAETAGLMSVDQNNRLAIALVSNPAGITGADAVTNIVSLTQAEYDAIATPNAATLYVITD